MVNSERLRYDPKAKPHHNRPVQNGVFGVLRSRFVTVVFRFVVIFSILSASLSYLMYGNFTFNIPIPSWTKIKGKYLTKQVRFTPDTLKEFDGTDPNKPIYLGFMGEVYDVTEGRDHYGPSGGYSFFAGRDAARAFITGCFQTHLTHDMRGLTEQQLTGVKEWQDFYNNHDKYFRVGYIDNPPIDPNSPIPPPCEDEYGNPIEQGGATAKDGQKPVGSK